MVDHLGAEGNALLGDLEARRQLIDREPRFVLELERALDRSVGKVEHDCHRALFAGNSSFALDDTHDEIRASLVDMVLANPKILGKFRTAPAARNGKREGAKIYAIRPSSLLARLGFANGDTVLLINKRSIDPPNDLHELHTMFRDTKLVVVDLERRGKPVMMMFKVTP